MIDNKNFHIEKETTGLRITVKSMRKPILMYYSIVMALGLFALSICALIYFSIFEKKILISLLSFAVFFVLSILFLNGFLWLLKGREVIEIDNLTSQLLIYKKGLFIFHKRTHDLKNLNNVTVCDKNQSNFEFASEDAIVYGYSGGEICLDINNKKYEFGASLSTDDALIIIKTLIDFLASTALK